MLSRLALHLLIVLLIAIPAPAAAQQAGQPPSPPVAQESGAAQATAAADDASDQATAADANQPTAPSETQQPVAAQPAANQAGQGPQAQEQPADSQASAPQPTTDNQPADLPPADEQPSEADQPQQLTTEQLEDELQEVEARIQSAQDAVSPERAAELGVSEDDLRRQVTLLQDLQNVIQRRITSRARRAELERTIAGLEQQVAALGPVPVQEEPPYQLSRLDGLRDELAAARRELESHQSSLETAEDWLSQATQQLQQAGQNRRRLREQLVAAGQDASRPVLQWQVRLAQLTERIADHELAQAEIQQQIAELQIRASELHIELLEAQVAFVEERVQFRQSELDARLAELDARRTELETELSALRRTDGANQVRVRGAREALEEARSELEQGRSEEDIRRLTEALAARDAAAQTSSRGVALLQERISNLATFRTLWEQRLALTRDPSEAELADWQRATQDTLDEAVRRREDAERRLQTQRATRLELENRLASTNGDVPARAELEARVAALEAREAYETNYLSSRYNLELLAQRVADEVTEARRLNSWRRYWSRLVFTAQSNWNREVFDIDDQAFRLGQLILAAAVFCLVNIVAWLMHAFIRRMVLRRQRARGDASDVLVHNSLFAVLGRTKWILVILVAAYLALMTLPLSESLQYYLNTSALVLVTIQVAIWANAAFIAMIDRARQRRMETDPSAASAFNLLDFFVRVAVWSAAFLMVLANLGQPIGPLLAGMGVGGVAVAFALQSILGDIFCSIAIVLDKPFVIGDFIIVGDLMGTVESIGIKTTRIRSLSGEQIVFSNADLIGSRVRNYKRMFERRIMFAFGIVYETPVEKLEQIPHMLQEIIESLENVRFDRAHFKEYGDFSLNFEVVYYVLVPEYMVYMDIQQKINLRLFRAFQEQDIAFAYPTRELIIRPNGNGKVTAQPHAVSAGETERGGW